MTRTLRYINVTTIDIMGAPTTSQILTNRIEDAHAYLSGKVEEGKRGTLNTWNKPIVAAFIFDTADQRLYRYSVVTIAGITAIQLAEVSK